MSKLWVVGCSIAHGVGVNSDQRWGNLVAQTIGIDPVFLTAEGSSIEWAADQILRADINQDDIVCWGLTTPNRSLWYDEQGQPQHILNIYYHHNPGFVLRQWHLVHLGLAYKAVNYVRQVQNYLGKIGCRYAIGYTLPGLPEHRELLLKNLSNSDNFFIAYDPGKVKNFDVQTFFKSISPTYNLFIDLGSDGIHPGPIQHRLFADQFLKKIGHNDTASLT